LQARQVRVLQCVFHAFAQPVFKFQVAMMCKYSLICLVPVGALYCLM
jgi:hypothetical protein